MIWVLTSHWNLHSSRLAVWIWSSVTGSRQSENALSPHVQSRPSLPFVPPKALQCEFSEYTSPRAAWRRKYYKTCQKYWSRAAFLWSVCLCCLFKGLTRMRTAFSAMADGTTSSCQYRCFICHAITFICSLWPQIVPILFIFLPLRVYLTLKNVRKLKIHSCIIKVQIE